MLTVDIMLITGAGRSYSIITSNRGVDAHMPPECRHAANMDTQDDIDWTSSAQSYPNIDEAPSFISQQRQEAGPRVFTTTASPTNLQGKQLQAYTIIQQHHSANNPPPLRMIVSGTAGCFQH